MINLIENTKHYLILFYVQKPNEVMYKLIYTDIF